MDKRTILFIIGLSLTLFGVNIYFQQQNAKAKEEWLSKQQVQKTEGQKRLSEQIAKRTANPADLPLISLYADAESKTFLSTGVLVDGHLLTLSWANELPAKAYVKKEEYSLSYSTKEVGSPVIYQKASTATPMPIGALPKFGSYDLQIVTLYPHDPKHPYGISLGEYTDGHFALPGAEPITIPENRPKFTGIALLKTSSGYLPVGFFSANYKSLVEFDELNNGLAPHVKKPEEKIAVTSSQKGQEKFYVLQNEYQQLVFSNYGGALVEINLAFQNAQNKASVVREIEFDREMVAKHPYNAQFPAHPYFTPGDAQAGPFKEHTSGQLGGYYPLLRRDLIQTGPRKTVRIPPQY